MRSRGDEAAFLGAESQRAFFESAGFRFSTFAEPDIGPGASAADRRRAVSWANSGHPAALAELAAADRFDLLVIDCLMFGALAGAEAMGLPAAVLIHSAPNALAPRGGGIDVSLLPSVNRLRRDLGLGPLRSVQDGWRPFLRLCTSIPELDPPGDPDDPPVHFVGPIFTAEQDMSWRSPWPPQDRRPLVLVSCSTGRAWDQSMRLDRTVAALAKAPFRVLVTAGGAALAPHEESRNIVVQARAPHLQVLSQAAATVTHCGHGTLTASLARGVPVVALPNLGADQEALSRRTEQLGAGLALDGDAADPAAILAAVRRVVSERSFRAAANGLAELIAGSPGPAGALERLDQLKAERGRIGSPSRSQSPAFPVPAPRDPL